MPENPTPKPVLKATISFDTVQQIAFTGIARALRFTTFAKTGVYDLEAINSYGDEGTIVRDTLVPSIKEEGFSTWRDHFLTWTFNNAFNEIIESFFTFLEQTDAILQMDGTKQLFESNATVNSVHEKINETIGENREALRNKNTLHALPEKGIALSEEEQNIISSLWEARNLLSHNISIVEERKNLPVQQGKITLTWYCCQTSIVLESGKEIEVTSDPLPEPGQVCLRPRTVQKKEIDVNTPLSLNATEVRQIGWTFWLLTKKISQQVTQWIEKKNASPES